MSQSGLEVTPGSDPQFAGPPDIHHEDKYYNRYNSAAGANPATAGQQNRPNRRVCGNKTTLWLLVLIAVIYLSAAVGAGIGAGMSVQRKSTTLA